MSSFKNFYNQDILEEKLSIGGFNYEAKIADKLKEKGMMKKEAKPAGSAGDTPDATMDVKGKTYNIEIKADKSAMFGQLELKYDDVHKEWVITERAKTKYPATSAFIAKSGFLKEVNKKWKKPSGDYQTDLKMGNVYFSVPGPGGIEAHYAIDRKTPYIQIGGKGLYHFISDEAHIGTTKLSGDTQLRARLKARGHDAQGRRTYGFLIVMGLKNIGPDSKQNIENW